VSGIIVGISDRAETSNGRPKGWQLDIFDGPKVDKAAFLDKLSGRTEVGKLLAGC
jgi:hypothetical protein